jgi:hypothetical protein
MSSDATFRVLVDVIEIQNVIWPAPSDNVKSKLPNPLVEVVVAGSFDYKYLYVGLN